MFPLLKTIVLSICLTTGSFASANNREDKQLNVFFNSPRRYGTYQPEFIPGPVPVPVSTPSYGSSSVVLPKPSKGIKSWTKNIFKQKGGLPSYVLPPPPTPIYTPNIYNEGYGYHYASGYSYGGSYSRQILPPYPVSPTYPSYPLSYGTYDHPFQPVRPALLGSGLYEVPSLIGAFDHYRGPIYYGGFRPTLGPYGGPTYSELLSVTDSYGRPLFPSYSLFGRKTDAGDVNLFKDNDIVRSAAVASLTASSNTETTRP